MVQGTGQGTHRAQAEGTPSHRVRNGTGSKVQRNIDSDQINIFKKLSPNLKKLSSERIYSEFKQILLSKELNNRLTVVFGIDGDEETNHLYRKNVDWKTLQKNWRAYISSGGRAGWQFIVFKWNQHQITDIKKLSEAEKFERFVVIKSFRKTNPENIIKFRKCVL